MEAFNPADHWEDVQRAARAVANNYPGAFDADDIGQSIFLDMLEHPARYTEGDYPLYDRLKRAGYRYCQQETADYYFFAGGCIYSGDQVRGFLPGYFSGEEFPERLDLDKALGKLRISQNRVLEKKNRDEQPLTSYEKKVHGQAVKAVTYYLNSGVMPLDESTLEDIYE